MSQASNTFENQFLKLLFQNIAIPKIGDVAGLQPSASPGSFYVRLCTDAVVASDSQIGTECAYTGYVAGGVAVERSASGWTINGSQVINAADIEFGPCTEGSENIRFVELWRNNTGNTEAERIAWKDLGEGNEIPVSAGATPKISAGNLTFTFD
jgi:hypothetical protein